MRRRPYRFKGLAVSPGIGIGWAQRIESVPIEFRKFRIPERDIVPEKARFLKAIRKTKRDLAQIKERLCQFHVAGEIRILESHQMLSSDTTLVQNTLTGIGLEKINAEWAFDKAVQELKTSFPKGEGTYFQERFEELNQVAQRILLNLLGEETVSLRRFKKGSIAVARELSPADTAQMMKGVVQGLVTESGGPTSHMAIVARALEIPTVVGIDGISRRIEEGDRILIDGNEGIVLLHPTKRDLLKYRSIQKKYQHLDHILLREAHLPSVTQDGYRLRLAANMELLEEIPAIKSHGAEGIGLFRTEILFTTHNRFLSEEEQFRIYKKILREISPHPTVIRTLDIGGEKGIRDWELETEGSNPALGLRAIRYCLKERDFLKTQLRAILRASPHGRVKLLIPMVTNLEEIRQVKKTISEIQKELCEKRIPYDPLMKIGAMVEIPSAALMAEELAGETDFLSIGTNDLIQYTLAVDRDNDQVSYLYQPLHPAVLKLLKMICDAGRSRNVEVSVCGEMAGHPLYFLILLGLGLTELSMNAVSIPLVKKLTREVTFRRAKELLDRALVCKTAGEVEHLIRRETATYPSHMRSGPTR